MAGCLLSLMPDPVLAHIMPDRKPDREPAFREARKRVTTHDSSALTTTYLDRMGDAAASAAVSDLDKSRGVGDQVAGVPAVETAWLPVVEAAWVPVVVTAMVPVVETADVEETARAPVVVTAIVPVVETADVEETTRVPVVVTAIVPVVETVRVLVMEAVRVPVVETAWMPVVDTAIVQGSGHITGAVRLDSTHASHGESMDAGGG